MLTIFDPLRDLTFVTVLARLGIAFFCGGAIGLERSYKNRPAGLRTHILISIGAAAASMTGIFLWLNQHFPTDISRIGASVVSGLGFIGGGTIIVTKKQTIKGLTTAAGLWACGIIGLAVGAGYYEGALLATALVLVTETAVFALSQRIPHSAAFRLVVTYREKSALDHILRYCKDKRLAISNLQVTGDGVAAEYRAVVSLRPRQSVDRSALLEHVRSVGCQAALEEGPDEDDAASVPTVNNSGKSN